MIEKGLIHHSDGKLRCPWPGVDPIYLAYHDTEWGVPEYDDRALFEKLILDGFQAGLSWITILRKRDNFRAAFDGFDPEKIARFTPKKVEKLLHDEGIIRHRGKIESTIKSAGIYLDIQAKSGFANYLWDFTDGRVIHNKPKSMADIATETEISKRMAKDLKRQGFNFCGPTIIHAFMQAVGMVNDHLVGCFRHEEVKRLERSL
jgi:DNA-3-methyladenine glycosylase I